jgi:hypothetical protein
MENRMTTVKRAGGLLAALFAAATLLGPVAFTQQNVVVVSGNITSDTTWTPNNVYVLRGTVFVENSVLRIEAGTRIVGEGASIGTLVITRSGQIYAEGRADAPIVFTSDQPAGSRGRANWGGLVISGDAPINVPGGEAFGEGDTGPYGGTNPDDSSGVLRYVRVEYAGIEFSPDNELNGIAFQGVGRGTVAEFLQVHFNKDDGIEFFGGTVDIKYAIVTGIGDDCFDWTEGWQGRAQFLIGQQHGDDADQGIEADSNAENNDLEPRAHPTIYNFTLLGDPDFNEGAESDEGMLIREGTGATLKNGVIMGFKEVGFNIDDTSTFTVAQNGGLVLENLVFFNNNPNFADDAADGGPFTTKQFAESNPLIYVRDPMLRGPFDLISPDFRPQTDSPLVNGELPVSLPPNDGFFEPAHFIGGIATDRDPNPDTPYTGNWLAGWTNYEPN